MSGPRFHVPQRPVERPAPAGTFTAVDAIAQIADVLANNGFDIRTWSGQSLIYRMANGDRFEVRAVKKRGR